jgi:hypothetical protein
MNNDHLSTTAIIFGSQGWSLYTSLTIFMKKRFWLSQADQKIWYEVGMDFEEEIIKKEWIRIHSATLLVPDKLEHNFAVRSSITSFFSFILYFSLSLFLILSFSFCLFFFLFGKYCSISRKN